MTTGWLELADAGSFLCYAMLALAIVLSLGFPQGSATASPRSGF